MNAPQPTAQELERLAEMLRRHNFIDVLTWQTPETLEAMIAQGIGTGPARRFAASMLEAMRTETR